MLLIEELSGDTYFSTAVSGSTPAFIEQVRTYIPGFAGVAAFWGKRMIWVCYALLLLLCSGTLAIAQPTPAQMSNSLQKAGNDSSRLRWYGALFRYYEYTNSDSALYYSGKAISAFENSGYLNGQARMLYMQGVLYSEKRMFALAINNIETALNLYMAMENQKQVAEMYNMLGTIEGNRGR